MQIDARLARLDLLDLLECNELAIRLPIRLLLWALGFSLSTLDARLSSGLDLVCCCCLLAALVCSGRSHEFV